jgi:type VI secretion system protein VasI
MHDAVIAAVIMAPFFLNSASVRAEDGKGCAAIADDSKRLICYDLIFKINQTSKVETKWTVEEQTSKIDDKKNVFVTVKSSERIPGRFGLKDNAELVFSCREGKSAFYIVFGGHFMSGLGSSGLVTYRVDKRPAAKRRMTESTDHQALGLWSAADATALARELFGAQSLYLQATPYSESPVSAEFPVAGLEEAIKPLQIACRWQLGTPVTNSAKTISLTSQRGQSAK